MEIWKKIKKYNNEYEVSNLGNVKSCFKVLIRSNGRPHTRVPKVLSLATNKSGYKTGVACIDKKMTPFLAHRLVAEAFIDNPLNKEEVNHINGIKTDNRVENLEWCTRQENIKHSLENNLQTAFKGEEVGTSILKETDVLDIRSSFTYGRKGGKPKKGDVSKTMLAEKYNVSIATIKDILQKRTWKHLL